MECITLSPEDLFKFSSNYLLTFHHVHASPARLARSPAGLRPVEGRIKLNFDGAVFAGSQEIRMGIVARDFSSHYVGWKSVRQQRREEPELLEAFAAREAILLAHRFKWRKIILEGDCSNVILKLSSPQLDWSAAGTVFRDIKTLFFYFDSCEFSLIGRFGNNIAHFLAKPGSVIISFGLFDSFAATSHR
ncbi:UNVERIFIED_CONTAM: hypothetical protein Sradi_0989400 [Sesamum radiatum]|uniref:RNase H type-1 domain-containing protein n=1 Tax=Sesamum radiatum TaxID=300843 RepID=A0AAW2V8L2_SESRA